MDPQLELWTEIIQECRSLSDPLFLECLESGNNGHIFARISDDDMQSILGITNKLLNDPKSRSRGMAVLEKVLSQISTPRFIPFQDSIISAFHMIVKDIDSIDTFNTLVKVIPICKQLSDVNQTITSIVVPKIMSYICNDGIDSEPSVEEMDLLKICLEKYHGPCGNYRSQLEKRFLHFIDHSTVHIDEVVPLLSSSGGGGSKGDKHGNDWYEMVMKINRSAYDTMFSLYSDACPVLEEENPFENQASKLNVPDISEPKVFLRMSLLKNRLKNLCDLVAGFLRTPFSAPKPVPVKSILRLISNILLLNPVDLLKKSQFAAPKEFYFLASVLPSIHESCFKLLKELMTSVGTNLFPEASRIEQLILQELKWMSTEQKSYENLKIEIYLALITWLKISKNSITNSKFGVTVVDFIGKDIQIEKETVTLSSTVGFGKSKHKKRKSASDFDHSTGPGSGSTSYAGKSPEVTSLALELITRLIPCLELSDFVKIYQMIAKTIIYMTQSSSPPSPYDDHKCRSKLYYCVLALAINPHPQSSSSLSLLSNLARRGVDDSVASVSTVAHQILSTLERLIHPICPSMDFVNVSLPAAAIAQENATTVESESNAENESEIEMFEASCQTDIAATPTCIESPFAETPAFSTPIGTLNSLDLKRLIAEAIRENMDDISTPRIASENYTNDNKINRTVSFGSPRKELFPTALPTTSSPMNSPSVRKTCETNGFGEGEGKRKCEDEVHSYPEEEQSTTKRQKITTEDNTEVEEMLLSFVDIGCNEN